MVDVPPPELRGRSAWLSAPGSVGLCPSCPGTDTAALPALPALSGHVRPLATQRDSPEATAVSAQILDSIIPQRVFLRETQRVRA